MLEQLMGGLKDQIGPLLSQEGLDSSKLEDVAKLSGESISEGMMSEASSGGLDNIMGLFLSESPTSTNNNMVSSVIGNLTGKLSSSLGMDSSKANSIAQKIIPVAIDFIGKQFRDSDNENNAQGLADFVGMDSGSIMGKAKDMLGDKLGGLFGK